MAELDSTARVSSASLPPSAKYTNNGTWVGYSYLSDPSSWSRLPDVASRMKRNQVSYWFLNVGSLDRTGKLKGPVSDAAYFLSILKTWENQHGFQFKVFAWLNANVPPVDVADAAVRTNIAEECKKLVSASEPDSYVAGASRAFDGVQLDLEPAGQDTNQLNAIVNLFDQVRSGFDGIGVHDKLTSFTPGKCGTRNKWWSSPEFYYRLAAHLDLICAMTYDSGITNGPAFQSWMQEQTTNVLRAVSGRTWDNDDQHPAPTNGVKVLMGLAAFPNSTYHTNTVENISNGIPGVVAGLADLQAHGDFSINYFQGAAVYALTDGTGNDGYSSYDTDWQTFRQDWLKARLQR